MSSKAMSLKAKIKNYAKNNNIAAQVVLQNYMFERFLARMSKSEYSEKFVIKGGMLIAAIVGLDTRFMMDLDTYTGRLLMGRRKTKRVKLPIVIPAGLSHPQTGSQNNLPIRAQDFNPKRIIALLPGK